MHIIRWEVRYEFSDRDKNCTDYGISSLKTRALARAEMRRCKLYPEVYFNVQMYRVKEYFDEKGNLVLATFKKAR